MSFQYIKRVEKAQHYLDTALRRAAGRKGKKLRNSQLQNAKTKDLERINIIRNYLVTKFKEITKHFPVLDNLSEFYKELVKTTLNYNQLRKSLRSVEWAQRKITELTRTYRMKLIRARNIEILTKEKKAFIGRVSSIVRQLNKPLETLEEARLVMKDYPVIKPGIFTVCIAGFPNVGKTTLLSRLTSSVPEIKAYPFTTKRLNLGYASLRGKEVQFIDTPGTLARPNKMNSIEKQAYLAMKYLADVIIYVFDLTEPYPLADQKRLLGRISRLGKPVITYLSKTDVLERSVVEEFSKKEGAILTLNKLREEISRRILESN